MYNVFKSNTQAIFRNFFHLPELILLDIITLSLKLGKSKQLNTISNPGEKTYQVVKGLY